LGRLTVEVEGEVSGTVGDQRVVAEFGVLGRGEFEGRPGR
jgi:hypothetical protein